jgi:hypothetical protein
MPHYKCVPCRARTQHTGKLGDPIGDICPQCGAPLEPVGDLQEVIGFERVRPSRSASFDVPVAQSVAVALPPPPPQKTVGS